MKILINEALPRLKAALAENNICLLTAPPGAGKTTAVPPSLLNEPWLNGKKIIMLEPRRLAARRSAEFMALSRGERCGLTIGYRIRNEACISKTTRIEVVTEGILTRMLQSDAELPETGLVIFDEFHERSIHADTGLAFLLDIQKNLRPDLKIIIMSATPDINKLKKLLNDPPLIEAHGRAFPVETHYAHFPSDKNIESKTAEAVVNALKKEEGDILVFLPGKREIKRTGQLLSDRLRDKNVVIHELYGEAPREEQDAALRPSRPEQRKVILSTSIAETSLTIDGVTIVIDAGLSRISGFDVRRGMPGLITVPVSKASADQRRGRAGRQQPGICYRLWTISEETTHPEHTPPEILIADLAPLALELAQWGTPRAEGLSFPDPPPQANLAQAVSVLYMLGAVDKSGKLTAFGKRMCQLPVHPRYSAMILHAADMNLGAQACVVAALLEEKNGSAITNDIDLDEYLHAIQEPHGARDTALKNRVLEQASRLQKIIKAPDMPISTQNSGILLALVYPERTAKRKSGSQYQLAQGTMVSIPESSRLMREEYIAIGDVDAAGAVAKVFLAASVSSREILEVFKDILSNEETVEWTDGAVRGKKRIKLGAISIQEKEFNPPESEAQQCVIGMIQAAGINILPWNNQSRELQQRSEWCRLYALDNNQNIDWPVMTDDELLNTLGKWLSPFLAGVRKKKDLENLDSTTILKSMFTYAQLNLLETMAPAGIQVPGGSTIRLKYDMGEKPVLAVRLQELFGQTDTPTVGGGKIPVLIHLLSPAMRPLAITQDLRSFWINVYPGILKQMRIKYPKHVWPENPLTALPTNKTKKGNAFR